jgi:hypothetical protein
MTSEDLRRQNSCLRDRIRHVLEMHAELFDGTEAMALRQDLMRSALRSSNERQATGAGASDHPESPRVAALFR